MTKQASDRKLPPPNAAFRASGQSGDFTPAEVRGIISNPLYAGVGPFPQLVSDEQWIAAATVAIREQGAEQFLVNLLHMLRQTMGEYEEEE